MNIEHVQDSTVDEYPTAISVHHNVPETHVVLLYSREKMNSKQIKLNKKLITKYSTLYLIFDIALKK